MEEIDLKKKSIGLIDVKEFIPKPNQVGLKFNIPGYQRGYRWTCNEALTLINDLNDYFKDLNKSESWYSLQVLVVQVEENTFEIVDGQQRLTTIFLLLQAIYIAGKIITGETPSGCLKQIYGIQYHTREHSDIWMPELLKAFLLDRSNGNEIEKKAYGGKDPDRYHFADVFYAAMKEFLQYDEDSLNIFARNLRSKSKFIWYNLSQLPYQESKETIFNRLNATKISLNNAELIKALFLQDANFPQTEAGSIIRDRMACEWDDIEYALQDNDFWGFIYSTKHGLKYDTRIEYLFDLIKGKTVENIDQNRFTFDKYYQEYRLLSNQEQKNAFAISSWQMVTNMFHKLQEWNSDRCLFHYIGYLLEYGTLDRQRITIPILIQRYEHWKKADIKKDLSILIGNSINFESDVMTYAHRDHLQQILLLFNVIEENNRDNDYARFSFFQYKQISENPGWNMEHVASHVDYTLKPEDKGNLACSLIEYMLGIKPLNVEIYKLGPNEIQDKTEYINYINEYNNKISNVNAEIKTLCDKIIGLFTLDASNEDNISTTLRATMDAINEYFDPDTSDQLVDTEKYKEKNFIWNFVLLNASTNKSYGNNIFPLKRQRIISDDSLIYTPLGTRNVFDKTYCTKLNSFMKWGRSDARLYWERIKTVLSPYKQINDPEFLTHK